MSSISLTLAQARLAVAASREISLDRPLERFARFVGADTIKT
jgi:hypothetical protein